MAAGLGVLRIAPAAFWSMTLPEFAAAVRGGLGLGQGGCPPSREDVAALMAQFPDH